MNNRQLGVLKISASMIETEPENVAKCFAKINFVPVRAEYLYVQNAIQYVGISDRFAVLKEGAMAPEYELRITKEGDDFTVDVKKALR